MASCDVAKNVMQLKLQLTEKAKSTTVLKILQKLKDLDITLEILAETGIGKTVNSFRKHELAGELAKSLVRYWKKLVPKDSTSSTVDDEALQDMNTAKSDDLNISKNESLSTEKLRRCFDSPGKIQDASERGVIKTENGICVTEKKRLQEREQKDENGNFSSQQESQIPAKEHLSKKLEKQEEVTYSGTSKKNNQSDKRQDYNKTSEGNLESKSDHFLSNSDEKVGEHKSSKRKQQQSPKSIPKLPADESFSCESNCRSELPESSQTHNGKERVVVEGKQLCLKSKRKSENEGTQNAKNQKSKKKQKGKLENDIEKPSMSFESYLSYDLNASKRKERSGTKNTSKKGQTKVFKSEKELTKEVIMQSAKLPTTSDDVITRNAVKRSVMDFLNTPLPAYLSECDNPSCTDYFEGKVMKMPDYCDDPEEPIFTGQRLNRKMQVYSGAKTTFLPTMMTLYQQCIRTLQNNIDLLYDTGGVPFEILEPVLERCTPEQLLRIEEFNPVYIGVTDHLWGKHCQRDFRNSKLQEYESWKEMYIRLSEERERKLKKLTKTIVSAHSKRPKGRQVKMAFIHTVAKPPRDVRIQQEIHGTAVAIQQPHLARPSAKLQDNRIRPSCVEPSKSSTTNSGTSNSQDPRKKARVAPMMAKSLKAFKKLGRR